jgi:hypothetical protein
MSVYTVPALNAVDFALTAHTVPSLASPETALQAYTVPALNAVDFALTTTTPPTYMDVGWELLPSGGGGLTLDAGSGAYTLTGVAATLRIARRLQSETGVYALTGVAASLRIGRRLSAETGSYSLTGVAATLRTARVIPAETGVYALSGVAANLRVGKSLQAETGAYEIAGQDVTFELTAAPVVEDTTRGKSGWDPYYYKARPKKKKKREQVEQFLAETQALNAPQEIQAKADAAREAAQRFLAIRDEAFQREAQALLAKALDRIDAFYEAARAEAQRIADDDEEDTELLLMS